MYAELAQYVYSKRKAVELATDPVAPQQSKLVVEFVRARPTLNRISGSEPSRIADWRALAIEEVLAALFKICDADVVSRADRDADAVESDRTSVGLHQSGRGFLGFLFLSSGVIVA